MHLYVVYHDCLKYANVAQVVGRAQDTYQSQAEV